MLPTSLLLPALLLPTGASAQVTNRVLDDVVVGQTVEADEFHRAFAEIGERSTVGSRSCLVPWR